MSPVEGNHIILEERNPSNVPEPPPPPPAAASDEAFPEGGYGWVIVGACSAITFFYVGFPYSWGLFQVRLAEAGIAPGRALAFVGSIASSFVAIAAILNARLLKLLGTRTAALIASALFGGGQLLSSFAAHSFPGLLICCGFIVGSGIGIFFMACTSLPSQYFKRKRGLANGLVVGGGGLGGGVLSVTLNYLLDRVGVVWTFRILGSVALVTTTSCSLLLKDRARRGTTRIEWSYFRDPKFVLLFLCGGIGTFPILVPAFFIPQYAASIGISYATASFLLGGFNLSSFFGRIAFGALADLIGPLNSLILALLTSALSMLAIWPVSNSLGPLILFSIVSGAGNGGFFSVMPSTVGHMYGAHRVPVALAMIVTAWAGGYILGAPIAGWILDHYGGREAGRIAFRPAMYYAGSMSLGSVGLLLGARQLMTPKLFSFV